MIVKDTRKNSANVYVLFCVNFHIMVIVFKIFFVTLHCHLDKHVSLTNNFIMINKLSALLYANNVFVNASMAGYHSTLCSFDSVSKVEVTVYYENDSDVLKVESLLSQFLLPDSSSIDSRSSNGVYWSTLIVPFDL